MAPAWNGVERRRNSNGRREEDKAVCPLHSRTCMDIQNLESDMKKRVPNWVLSILVVILLSVLSAFMVITHNMQNSIAKGVRANELTLNEVTMNQRLVMNKLGLKYQYLNNRDKGD